MHSLAVVPSYGWRALTPIQQAPGWHQLCLFRAGSASGSVSELVYIPIYDLATPDAGVRAVLEVIVSSTATDVMVPNVISLVGMLLEELKVRLACTGCLRSCISPASASVYPCACS